MDGWMDDVAMVITLESYYSTGTSPFIVIETIWSAVTI